LPTFVWFPERKWLNLLSNEPERRLGLQDGLSPIDRTGSTL